MLGWWLPDNLSIHGGGVFHLVYWTSGLALLLAQLALARARSAAPSRAHALLEVVWGIVPALILVWLGLLSHRAAHEVADGRPQIALERLADGAHARAAAP